MSSKLNWEAFEKKLGSWAPRIKSFFDSGQMDPIMEYIKAESQRGKKIAPDSKDLFRCFTETPYEEMKVVICGLCPYHTERDNIIIADGLCMGASKTNHCPPSLQQFYSALEIELFDGLDLDGFFNPDVSYLAKQGVLMLNAALTTQIGIPKKHNDIWKPFTKFLMSDPISASGVPVIFLGDEASYFHGFLNPMQWNFNLSHPASASYRETQWDSNGVFSKVNQILIDNGKEPITWISSLPF